MEENAGKTNIILSNILKVGSYIGISLMVIGIILFLIAKKGFSPNTGIVPLSKAVEGIFRLDPLSLLTVGLAILIMTPVLRVIGAALSFLIVEKDKKYFLISTGVFIILMISIGIAWRK